MPRAALLDLWQHTFGRRLTIAQCQLHEGRVVKSIADELGYGNPSALLRVFTKQLGVSPRQWLADAASAHPDRNH